MADVNLHKEVEARLRLAQENLLAAAKGADALVDAKWTGELQDLATATGAQLYVWRAKFAGPKRSDGVTE